MQEIQKFFLMLKFLKILVIILIILVSLHCLYHGKEPTEVSNAEPVNQRSFLYLAIFINIFYFFSSQIL